MELKKLVRKKLVFKKVNHPLPERAIGLKKILLFLFDNKQIASREAFAIRMALPPIDLDRMIAGTKEITDSFALALEDAYGYPSKYLTEMPSEIFNPKTKKMAPRGAEFKQQIVFRTPTHPLPARAQGLRDIIQSLIGNGQINTKEDFAIRMDVEYQQLLSMLAGTKEITDVFAHTIEAEFGYRCTHLTTMPSETWCHKTRVMIPRGANYKRRENKPRKEDPTNIKVPTSKDGEWLVDIMGQLFNQEIIISRKDFALQLGIDPLRIYSLITGRIPIPYKKLIETKFGIYITSKNNTDNSNNF